MGAVDYYALLKEGPESISGGEWDEILRAVVYRKDAEADFDAALDAFQRLLFEGSSEWLDKKARIIDRAEKASSNPTRRSAYCLRSLQNFAADAVNEAARSDESPELTLVHRQVADHLRKLYGSKKLSSHRLRSRQGRDICNLWGLPDWGSDWLHRQPEAPLEEVRSELPTIVSSQPGKGVFDYASTLPEYLPTILLLHSAALSTAQLSSTVVAKISPPLARTGGAAEFDETHEGETESGWCGFTRIPGPEQLLRYKELRERFLGMLTERETRVFEMREEGIPVDEIAERLRCSKRTVNNDWQSIFEKCRRCLAA